MAENKRVISETLEDLVYRVEQSQIVLDKDISKIFKEINSRDIADITSNLELLEALLRETRLLEKNPISTQKGILETFLQKKSTNDVIREIDESCRQQIKSVTNTIDTIIDGLMVIKDNIFSKIYSSDLVKMKQNVISYDQSLKQKKDVQIGKTVNERIKSIVSNDKFWPKESQKLFEKMQTKELIYQIKYDEQVQDCTIVYGSMLFGRLKERKKKEAIIKAINEAEEKGKYGNLEEEIKELRASLLNNFTKARYITITEQDILEVTKIIDAYISCKRTEVKLRRIKDIIHDQLNEFVLPNPKQKQVLMDTITKELDVLKKKMHQLIEQNLHSLKEQLEKRDKKAKETKEKVDNIIEMTRKKEQIQERRQQKDYLEKTQEIEDKMEASKEKEEQRQKEKKNSEQYRKLTEIRHQIDDIRESITNNECEFRARTLYGIMPAQMTTEVYAKMRKEILNQKVQRLLNLSSDEVLERQQQILNGIENLSIITTMLQECKIELEEEGKDLYQVQDNGFTLLEQYFEQKLQAKAKEARLSEELKEEIRYYLEKYEKVKDSIYMFPIGSMELKQLAKDMKERYFEGTILENEVTKSQDGNMKK